MKFLILFFVLLNTTCFTQELIEVDWGKNIKEKNPEEIEESQKYLESNNLNIGEIYNLKQGEIGKLEGGSPYIFIKNEDTITYMLPGIFMPTTREKFTNNNLNNEKGGTFFIELIRNNGELGLTYFADYIFLIENNKLYHLHPSSSLSKDVEMDLLDKMIMSNNEKEKNEIRQELDKHEYLEKELIIDLDLQKKADDKIKISKGRYSILEEIILKDGKELFRVKSKITIFELTEMEFIIDKDFNFFKIEDYKIKN